MNQRMRLDDSDAFVCIRPAQHPPMFRFNNACLHAHGFSMLALFMVNTSLADTASSIRTITDESVDAGATVTVSITLQIPDPAPTGLILKEIIPEGFEIQNPIWNGQPLQSNISDGEYKWLFGFNPPVTNGTLTYQTVAVGSPGSSYTFTGSILYGTNTEVQTTGDSTLRIHDPDDLDGDGIPNEWEILHFGGATAADANRDYDGDGMTALEEYIADTDPNDRESYLGIDAIASLAEGVRIEWRGGVQAIQFIESSHDLTDPADWEVRHTIHPPTPVTNSWIDPAPLGSDRRFYRVRATRMHSEED